MNPKSLIVFDTEIYINNPNNPFSNENPIVTISCLYSMNDLNYINIFTTANLNLISTLNNQNIKIVKCKNELQLIYFFYHYVNLKKPTYLTGYNICGFDFNYIHSRLLNLSNLYNKPIEKKLAEKFNLIWTESKNSINLSDNKKLNSFVCTEKYYKFSNIQIVDLAIISKKKIKLDLYNISNVINASIGQTYDIADINLYKNVESNNDSIINNQIDLLTKLQKVFINWFELN